MIVGIDIGGTKTLVSLFAENGKLLDEVRFETPKDYQVFLQTLTQHAKDMGLQKAKIACVAAPGLLDRESGVAISLGNLPWRNKSIRRDLAELLGIPVYIENDSKLAGLSEARYLQNKYQRILYITISTGIGTALVINGQLSADLLDSELGKIPLIHNNEIMPWENFASGRAFYAKYGKKAFEVKDQNIWGEFSQYINQGLGIACGAYQPEAIVFGGGLGQWVSQFKPFLEKYLKENLHPNVRQPKLYATHYKDESVIYGCYAYAKDKLA